MFYKKIFYCFLIFVSLNMFGFNNLTFLEAKFDKSSTETKKPCTKTNQTLSYCNGQIIISGSSSQKKSVPAIRSLGLPKHVALKLLELRYLPEINELVICDKKNKSKNTIDYLMKSLAARYKIITFTVEDFSTLTFKELKERIVKLKIKIQKIKTNISLCKQNIKIKKRAYNNTSWIHVHKKPKRLNSLLQERKNYAKALADRSIAEDKLKDVTEIKEATIKRINNKNLKQATEIYEAISKENSLSPESLTYDNALHEGISRKRIEIAKNSKDLQECIQKEMTYHTMENQQLRKNYGKERVLTPLIDKHEECIKKSLAYNKHGDIKKAMTFSDLCWRIAGTVKSIAKTMSNIGEVALNLGELVTEATINSAECAYNTISDAILNGDKHVESAFKGTMDGTNDTVNAVFKPSRETLEKVDIINNYLKLASGFFDICIKSVTSPSLAKENIQTWKEGLRDFMEITKTSEQYTDITKISSKMISEGVLIASGAKLLKNLYQAACATLTERVKDTFENIKNTFASAKETTGHLVKPLGKGSTGRFLPQNLTEKLAMEEVMSNPLAKDCTELIKVIMKDTKNGWLAKDGWVKMQKIFNSANSKGKNIQIKIHYLWNNITNEFDDFKFC